VIWLAILIVACQTKTPDADGISIGASRADVRALMGEPERVQEFELPDAPFFGPQESLIDLVPAGTPVEEWVYIQGEEEQYVWFAGEAGQAKDLWRVIETARYPVGAVY
jgi:hypothetical protein